MSHSDDDMLLLCGADGRCVWLFGSALHLTLTYTTTLHAVHGQLELRLGEPSKILDKM